MNYVIIFTIMEEYDRVKFALWLSSLFLAVLVVLLSIQVWNVFHQFSWHSTSGYITKWIERDWKRKKRFEWGTAITKSYTYTVNGVEYSGVYNSSKYYTSERFGVQNRLAPGYKQPVTVYYNPNSPSSSTLKKASFDVDHLAFLLLILFFTWYVSSRFSDLKEIKKQISQS